VAIWKTKAILKAVVIYVPTEAAIKCWPYPESNSEHVLSRTSLIFVTGYFDCANVVGSDLDVRGWIERVFSLTSSIYHLARVGIGC
jgi:hypothetical protein